MRCDESIDAFLTYLSTERHLSEGSLRAYGKDLRAFVAYLHEQGIEEVADVSMQEPRQWQMICSDRGLNPRSVKRMLSALRGWCRYARRMGWTRCDFMAKVVAPRCHVSLPVAFRIADAERIYEADFFPDTFEGHRDRLLLQLLYETGVRRSEAAGLRLSSVDAAELLIRVVGKRSKERVVPIHEELLRSIQRYIDLRKDIPCADDHLFVNAKGKAMTDAMIYTVVKRCMSFAVVDHASPHVFRHTFATGILNGGGNIMAIKDLLGHSSLNATQIYAHVSRQHLREVYLAAHPRARKEQSKDKPQP